MHWDLDYALDSLPILGQGLLVTLQITLLGTLIALVVGLFVAVVRRLRIPGVSRLFSFLMLFIRGTPLLVQAYIAYLVLPQYGLKLGALATGIIVIGINYSAYTAEVYRSGIEGVAVGQWEASVALNLPARRTWGRIVLPQAVRTVIPMLGNYLIQMFKDSAVLSAITIVDLLGAANAIGNDNFRYLEPITMAGLLYVAISYPAAVLIRRLERRYAST